MRGGMRWPWLKRLLGPWPCKRSASSSFLQFLQFLASPAMAGKDSSMQAFVMDFMLGGVSGAVSKTLTAPIERVKLVVQTQDANPKIRSGEVPRYTGMVDCAQRIMKEQGFKRFWDGNLTNCIRYFPTQAFNLAFKDTFKKMFPKYNPKTEFWQFFGANLVSGGLAAAASMTIVYPLDYARTRLASDVGSGKKTFSGLGDCIVKTVQGPGGFALYTGFGVSVCGIIGYRGLQLGTFDTITGLNPYKKDKGILGAVSTFAAAQTAITIGAGATYPFDTVRRRLQMQSEKPPEEHIYKGTADCFKKIAAEEGRGPSPSPKAQAAVGRLLGFGLQNFRYFRLGRRPLQGIPGQRRAQRGRRIGAGPESQTSSAHKITQENRMNR